MAVFAEEMAVPARLPDRRDMRERRLSALEEAIEPDTDMVHGRV